MAVKRLTLVALLGRRDPPLADPLASILAGEIQVDGSVVTNPDSRVRLDARVVHVPRRRLRGALKLSFAMDTFHVDPAGRAALDLGACTGGFTQVLLERGARKVFAVEVGYGQLRGWLRQDPRVVSLERTNASQVTRALLGEPVSLIVADVTYVPSSVIVGEVTQGLQPDPGTELVVLVKPMFELGRGTLPKSETDLLAARDAAVAGYEGNGWSVIDTRRSPVPGQNGATELFVHGRYRGRPAGGRDHSPLLYPPADG